MPGEHRNLPWILESTVYQRRGARRVSARMGDIAKESGISRQAIYLHFTSRTDLPLLRQPRNWEEILDVDKRSRAIAW